MFIHNILFPRIIKLLSAFELGNTKYILMFAGIGCGAFAVIVLVVVACVKKSRSATFKGKYISTQSCMEDLSYFSILKNMKVYYMTK